MVQMQFADRGVLDAFEAWYAAASKEWIKQFRQRARGRRALGRRRGAGLREAARVGRPRFAGSTAVPAIGAAVPAPLRTYGHADGPSDPRGKLVSGAIRVNAVHAILKDTWTSSRLRVVPER